MHLPLLAIAMLCSIKLEKLQLLLLLQLVLYFSFTKVE
jgi:hypothetical protein